MIFAVAILLAVIAFGACSLGNLPAWAGLLAAAIGLSLGLVMGSASRRNRRQR